MLMKRSRRISNNVLLVLVVFAVISSVIGTLVSLNMISLTGRATTLEGTTNLTVTSVTSCAINDSLVSFGSMQRNEYNTSAELNTTSDEAGSIGDFMMITNDGNTNITIFVNVSVDEDDWLWDTKPSSSTFWAVRCENSDDGNSSNNQSWADVPGEGNPAYTIITRLTPVANAGGTPLDNVTVGFNVTVPADEPTGYKNGTVTFFCSETSG